MQEQSAGEAVPVRQEIGAKDGARGHPERSRQQNRKQQDKMQDAGSEENGIVGTAAPLEFIVDRTNFQSGRPAHFWIEECR